MRVSNGLILVGLLVGVYEREGQVLVSVCEKKKMNLSFLILLYDYLNSSFLVITNI